MMPISDSTPFAMQAGHFFLKTTFFVVEIFAGRFAAISNILLPGRNPVLWTSMPPGMNYWKTVRLSSPPNRGGGLIAPRFDWVNLFCLLLALCRPHTAATTARGAVLFRYRSIRPAKHAGSTTAATSLAHPETVRARGRGCCEVQRWQDHNW